MAVIDLNIDRLVLRGFDPRHRYRIADALQSELERLLLEEGFPPGWEEQSLNGTQSIVFPTQKVEIAPNLRPEDAGIQIARALYAQLAQVD